MKISRDVRTPRAKRPVQSAKATRRPEYIQCEKYIRAAIEAVGPAAKNDPKSREIIANLGVVLLDMQSK